MNKKYNFKVGDRVRIRQWDDMAKELGLDGDGDIKCEYCFTRCMKHLCGRIAKITKLEGIRVFLEFENVKGKTSWSYSTDMIEPQNECIVIYSKGSEVIALDKTTGEKALAKCSPDDQFDFLIGAKLAFERLLGIDKHFIELKEGDDPEEIMKQYDGLCHKFKDGKTYVFRKELFRKNGWKSTCTWVDECDGMIVTGKSKGTRMMNGYLCSPEWCEELEIAVGDMVEVIGRGETYTTYINFEGLKGYEQNFVKGKLTSNGKTYKLLKLENHELKSQGILALIQDPDTTQVFIIGIDGIKKA